MKNSGAQQLARGKQGMKVWLLGMGTTFNYKRSTTVTQIELFGNNEIKLFVPESYVSCVTVTNGCTAIGVWWSDFAPCPRNQPAISILTLRRLLLIQYFAAPSSWVRDLQALHLPPKMGLVPVFWKPNLTWTGSSTHMMKRNLWLQEVLKLTIPKDLIWVLIF